MSKRKRPTKPAPPIDPQAPHAVQRRDISAADGTILRTARVEVGEWRDPDDTVALERGADGKRHQRTVKGYRVVDPILHLHRRSPGEVTERHVRSANRLRDDYEAHLGANSGRAPRVSGGGSGWEPADYQIDAISRVSAAFNAVGPSMWHVLMPVVIHGWTVGRLAEARGSSAHRVQGYLVAALDRLADHYEPAVQRGMAREAVPA